MSCYVTEKTALLPLPGGRSLTLGEAVVVMGIVNCTPDSFSDGGCYGDAAAASDAALAMVADGAEILDVGGESSRPGAAAVSVAEECARVLPVIEMIRRETAAPISIDTTKADVARAALAVGADIINDITALQGDAEMAEVVATNGAALVLMHMRGTPTTMQNAPGYDDVVQTVTAFLMQQAKRAEQAGIARARIILDPGFGFGKTFAHNAALLQNLATLAARGYPVLAGLSRKSLIGDALDLPVAERLEASLALAVLAAERGATIVRVHDVRATVRALRMREAILATEGDGI